MTDEDGVYTDVATHGTTVSNVTPESIVVTSGRLDNAGSGNARFTAAAASSDPGADTWTATINYGEPLSC